MLHACQPTYMGAARVSSHRDKIWVLQGMPANIYGATAMSGQPTGIKLWRSSVQANNICATAISDPADRIKYMGAPSVPAMYMWPL